MFISYIIILLFLVKTIAMVKLNIWVLQVISQIYSSQRLSIQIAITIQKALLLIRSPIQKTRFDHNLVDLLDIK